MSWKPWIAGVIIGGLANFSPPVRPAGAQTTGSRQDAELAAALTKRDVGAATRLLAGALAQPIALPTAHPAIAILGPDAATNLDQLFAASGDRAAAARINNLGVALALRGWFESAAVAFGGALMSGEHLYAGRPWPSVTDPYALPAGLSMRQQYSTTPNPAIVNVQNLQRARLTTKTPRSEPNRYEFSIGLLETAEKWPSPTERLRAMAEVFPPVVSIALADALRQSSSPEGLDQGLFMRVYRGFAQYKGKFLRGIVARPVIAPGTPTMAGGNASPVRAGGQVWTREEVWDDRGLHGFDPANRLQAGEVLIDVYSVEIGDTPRELRREYIAVIVPGASAGATGAPQRRVLSLGPADQVHQAIDDFWDRLIGEKQRMDAAALRGLADRMWRPLAGALPTGTRRVWLSPDGRLGQIPWQALSVLASGASGPAISVVDSGETIRERRPRPPTPNRRILLAGNPDYGTGAQFSPLPQSAAEISLIEGIARANGHEATVLLGGRVVEPAIRGALPARIIHIATHGVFRAAGFRPTVFAAGPWLVLDPTLRSTPGGRPAAQTDVIGGFDLKAYEKRMAEIVEETRRTGRRPTNDELRAAVSEAKGAGTARELSPVSQGVLALTGANTIADPFAANSPAFLTDVDLATLDLTATDLVVLSACDLGQADQSAFQGLSSMQTTVVVAGARSLVSSLWKVPDAEATAFMQRFYENLLVRGLSRSDALREAQQSASVDASGRPRSPYLWAGWTLFGEGW